MAQPNIHGNIKRLQGHNLPWISTEPTGTVEIFVTEHRIIEAVQITETLFRGNYRQETTPKIIDIFHVPLYILSHPICCEDYLTQQFARLNFDSNIRNSLRQQITSLAISLAWHSLWRQGFSITAYLELTKVEWLDGHMVLDGILATEQQTTDSAAIDRRLTKERFSGSGGGGGDDTTCAICLEEFCSGKEVARLPCSHVFDYKCILKWLNKSTTCPTCRGVF